MLLSTLMALSVAALAGCPSPVSPGVTITTDVTYAVGYVSDSDTSTTWTLKPLLIDIYEPASSKATNPAILLVHGGSFTDGSKEKEEIVEYAKFFANHGYVAFAMNYRLSGDYPPAPSYWQTLAVTSSAHAAMVDIKNAVRFIRANAEEYGVDTERIGLMGESAGAIAGAAVAFTDDDEFVTDGDEFAVPEQNHPGISARVNAYCHFWGNADLFLTEVDRNDPPVMIVHGTDDDETFTPFASAKRLHSLLELYGIPHEFYEAEGYGHGAWEYRNNMKNLKQLMLAFLDEQLG